MTSKEYNYPEIRARVVRGPSWKWSDQDGGEGGVGTVVYFGRGGKYAYAAWDLTEKTADYRCGPDDYDLRILDNAPSGVKFDSTTCDGCGEGPILGIRWQCATCKDKLPSGYDLCSACYHGNKHDLSHEFNRYNTPGSTPVHLNARMKYFRKQAKGTFPGAVVGRGRDWRYDDQDGGAERTPSGLKIKAGIVIKTCNWGSSGARDAVVVRWSHGSNHVNCYRLGAENSVDVYAPKPEIGMLYYEDHLPRLGADRFGKDIGDRGGGSGSSGDARERLAALFAQLLVDQVRNT